MDIDNLLQDPDSALAEVDLKAMIMDAAESITADEMNDLVDLLPPADKVFIDNGTQDLIYPQSLEEYEQFSDQTDKYTVLLATGHYKPTRGRTTWKEGEQELLPYKDDEYERYWGERLQKDMQRKRAIEKASKRTKGKGVQKTAATKESTVTGSRGRGRGRGRARGRGRGRGRERGASTSSPHMDASGASAEPEPEHEKTAFLVEEGVLEEKEGEPTTAMKTRSKSRKSKQSSINVKEEDVNQDEANKDHKELPITNEEDTSISASEKKATNTKEDKPKNVIKRKGRPPKRKQPDNIMDECVKQDEVDQGHEGLPIVNEECNSARMNEKKDEPTPANKGSRSSKRKRVRSSVEQNVYRNKAEEDFEELSTVDEEKNVKHANEEDNESSPASRRTLRGLTKMRPSNTNEENTYKYEVNTDHGEGSVANEQRTSILSSEQEDESKPRIKRIRLSSKGKEASSSHEGNVYQDKAEKNLEGLLIAEEEKRIKHTSEEVDASRPVNETTPRMHKKKLPSHTNEENEVDSPLSSEEEDEARPKIKIPRIRLELKRPDNVNEDDPQKDTGESRHH